MLVTARKPAEYETIVWTGWMGTMFMYYSFVTYAFENAVSILNLALQPDRFASGLFRNS